MADVLDAAGWFLTPGLKIGQSIGSNIVDNVSTKIEETAESFDSRKENEVNFRKSTNNLTTLLNVGGCIAGALGGWKLGENFGTVGKVVGGVGLAIVGTKLGSIVKEIGTDVAAAQDYSREAEKKGVSGTFGKAFWNNLTNLGGQSFDGASGSEITVDEPDL